MGPQRQRFSPQVCRNCKARKKKCDKVLPSCGSCIKSGVKCRYTAPSTTRQADSPSTIRHSTTILPELSSTETTLHIQAQRLIRSTGQYVDDISSRYFRTVHRYYPVISRTRFQQSLITLGSTPSADFSLLLLSICLASSSLELKRDDSSKPNSTDPWTIHLATKSLLAQMQVLARPTVYYVQANLLVALSEFVRNQSSDAALTSLAACARMAYSLRMHLQLREDHLLHTSSQETRSSASGSDFSERLGAREAANTWWGIVICERSMLCHATVSDQPFITTCPGPDDQLPTEPKFMEQTDIQGLEAAPYTAVSSLTDLDVGEFGRTAQATWLLDKVLKSLDVRNPNLRWKQLDEVDLSLQSFLGILMQQCQGHDGVFCEAIATTIRALFVIHSHVIAKSAYNTNVEEATVFFSLCDRAYATLDSVVKMVVDIAEDHEGRDTPLHHSVAPSYKHIIQAALNYIEQRPHGQEESWVLPAESLLRVSAERFESQAQQLQVLAEGHLQ